MSITVLLVDDDPGSRETMGAFLESLGYSVLRATSLDEGLTLAASHPVDVAFVDIRLFNSRDPAIGDNAAHGEAMPDTVILAGRGSRTAAIAAVRGGALDFIEKPFDFECVEISARRAVELTTLRREVVRLRSSVEATPAGEVADGVDHAPREATAPASLADVESRAIADALRATGGNKLRAAKVLGIARSTLLEKLKRQSMV